MDIFNPKSIIKFKSFFILDKKKRKEFRQKEQQKLKNNNKWGVSYSLFDGEELLEPSILSIRDCVDYINVVYQKESWVGTPATENIEKAMSIISKQVANGWIWELGKVIIFAVFLLLINYYFFHFKVSFDKERLTARLEVNLHLRKKSSWTISVDGLVYLILSIVILGYILVVGKIAPYQTDRYYMCVYPLIYIIIVHSIFGVLQRFGRTKISLSI